MDRLVGKTALITGGASDIGSAIASAYRAEGARVVIADINQEKGAAVAQKNQMPFNYLDITRQESIETTIAYVLQEHGRLDILVNNAAVFDMAPTTEIRREIYVRIFAVNVEGLLFMLQAAAKQMIKQGGGGKIINLASQAGRRGEPLVAVYCASKAAVISITQSTGLDLIRYGINVNGISPGVVDTDMWTEVDALFAKYEKRPLGEKKKLVGEAVPYGRMGKATDLVGAAIFLASAESDYILAQTINVDGGNWMS